MKTFALKGNIIFSKTTSELEVKENQYLICSEGCSQGVFDKLPEEYRDIEIVDCGNQLIIPGLVDLHVHAPQYTFRGIGMDRELLDWLNTYTFPEEGKYASIEYASRAYERFSSDLKACGTTRACVFGTIHKEATEVLMENMEKMGLRGYVGKVSMNRNAPDFLCEEDSILAVKEWLRDIEGKYEHVKPIVTPRFIPSCTDEIMKELAIIQREEGLPLQSHLSENEGEINWVRELCPDSTCYGDAYDKLGAFGSNGKTVMAHCVHPTEEELHLMKEREVYVAHCPDSNTNLASGIAPIRRYLDEEINIGLGSDVAGGHELSIFHAMKAAIQVSKLRWRLVDQELDALNIEEAFYMATKGGGSFFGKVGSFEKGYEFDALVLDDSALNPTLELSLRNRLERLVYSMKNDYITKIFIAGMEIS